jgi:hypothetical protein
MGEEKTRKKYQAPIETLDETQPEEKEEYQSYINSSWNRELLEMTLLMFQTQGTWA